jgi:hypothetical protein
MVRKDARSTNQVLRRLMASADFISKSVQEAITNWFDALKRTQSHLPPGAKPPPWEGEQHVMSVVPISAEECLAAVWSGAPDGSTTVRCGVCRVEFAVRRNEWTVRECSFVVVPPGSLSAALRSTGAYAQVVGLQSHVGIAGIAKPDFREATVESPGADSVTVALNRGFFFAILGRGEPVEFTPARVAFRTARGDLSVVDIPRFLPS